MRATSNQMLSTRDALPCLTLVSQRCVPVWSPSGLLEVLLSPRTRVNSRAWSRRQWQSYAVDAYGDKSAKESELRKLRRRAARKLQYALREPAADGGYESPPNSPGRESADGGTPRKVAEEWYETPASRADAGGQLTGRVGGRPKIALGLSKVAGGGGVTGGLAALSSRMMPSMLSQRDGRSKEEKDAAKERAEVAMSRMGARSLARGMTTWIAYYEHCCWQRKLIKGAATNIMHYGMLRGWRRWQSAYYNRVRLTQALKRASLRFVHREIIHGLRGWAAYMQKLADERLTERRLRRTIAQIRQPKVLASFGLWRAEFNPSAWGQQRANDGLCAGLASALAKCCRGAPTLSGNKEEKEKVEASVNTEAGAEEARVRAERMDAAKAAEEAEEAEEAGEVEEAGAAAQGSGAPSVAPDEPAAMEEEVATEEVATEEATEEAKEEAKEEALRAAHRARVLAASGAKGEAVKGEAKPDGGAAAAPEVTAEAAREGEAATEPPPAEAAKKVPVKKRCKTPDCEQREFHLGACDERQPSAEMETDEKLPISQTKPSRKRSEGGEALTELASEAPSAL